MDTSIKSIELLLREVAEHLAAASKANTNAAATKLHRIAEMATTMAFTVKGPRH